MPWTCTVPFFRWNIWRPDTPGPARTSVAASAGFGAGILAESLIPRPPVGRDAYPRT